MPGVRARIVTVALSLIFLIAITTTGVAQPAQGSSSGGKQGGGSAGGISQSSSLTGLSFVQFEWESRLQSPPNTVERSVLCYKLAPTNSAAQPFILQPVSQIFRSCKGENDPVGINECRDKKAEKDEAKWNVCTRLDEKHHLMMRQLLVVAIDARCVMAAMANHLKLLNINVVNQQGVAISPVPLRPSFGASSPTAVSLEAGVYYLTWPYQLPGDTIPTVSINALFTPAIPGFPWTANTLYPVGSVVIVPRGVDANGHYYVAIEGGISGDMPPTFPTSPIATVEDGNILWSDYGTNCPDVKQLKPWLPNFPFGKGDIVQSPLNGHCYVAVREGTSGRTQPNFPMTEKKFVTEKTKIMPITWQDVGTTAPVSVAGSPPSEQVISLLNQTLPQVHMLYYFNLTFGVVASTIKNRTFGFPQSGGAPIETSSNPLIDPVLFLTYYPRPLDAESPWQWSDLLRPGISLGLSLTDPTKHFYLGLTSEIQRNVQLVYGFSYAKVSDLAPGNTQPTDVSKSPNTIEEWKPGAYIGLTFNILGFIESLFKSVGGGGGGGSGK